MSRAARPLVAAVALGALVAFIVSRIDVGEAIKEVTLPLRHDDIIRQQAEEKNLDPALIAAVIYEESRFRDQTSSAGARGLMQITPETADHVANLSGGVAFETDDLANPDINIRYGAFWLSHLLEVYGGNSIPALAAYNAGQGNADRWGGAELEIDAIGFPETQAYVRNVLERREQYRANYAADLGL